MASKKDKRVAEIKELENILPDEGFTISISDNISSTLVNSYSHANALIQVLCPETRMDGLTQLRVKYVFASFITDKSVAKKLRVIVFKKLYQNFKQKL